MHKPILCNKEVSAILSALALYFIVVTSIVAYGVGHYAAIEHNAPVTFKDYALLQVCVAPLEKVAEIVTVLENLEEACKMAGLNDKADAASKDIQTILAEADKSSDRTILTDLADYYSEHDRPDDAQKALDRATTLLERHQTPRSKNEQSRDIGKSYHGLGRAYERLEMYDEALTAYQRAAQLLESRVRSQVYGVLMHDIGDVYRAQKRPDQAISYYEKAREYKDDPRDLTRTLHVLADVYAEQRQHERALAVYRDGLEKLQVLSSQV